MTATDCATDTATGPATVCAAVWSLRMVADRPHGRRPRPAEEPETGRRASLAIDWRPGGAG